MEQITVHQLYLREISDKVFERGYLTFVVKGGANNMINIHNEYIMLLIIGFCSTD